MVTVEQKIEHLRKLGLTGDMSEIAKMYRGEKFDPKDAEYQKLLSLSKSYCQRFTELSSLIAVAKSPEEATKYSNEKSAILDILFPYHGQIFGGGDDLYAVIGTVELDGFNYINTRVHFNGSSLVHLNPYVFVASSVDFGEKKEVTRMGTIEVGSDTWIGAEVIFDDNTRIGQRSVIGMGSHVVSGADLAASTISFGNPCHEYMPIPEDYETIIKVPGQEAQRTKDEIEFLIAHIQNLGIKGDFSQYIRSLTYEKYNTLEPTIGKIFDLSHRLCSEYNSDLISIRRRKEILDILFPLHGSNLRVGKDIYVDCIGTVKIGSDVAIGDHSSLAGNIFIGNNVTLGNGVTLQTTGHEIDYKKRHISTDENGNLCEISTPSFIVINPGIILADGTKVLPGQIVDRNSEKDEFITRSR